MQSHKLWTKDFIGSSFINFFLTLVFYLLIVTMATYAIEQYHASISTSGLVSGLFVIGGLTGRLISGALIHKLGANRLLIITISICIILIGLYFMDFGIVFLVLLRFLHGVPHGMALTAISSIVAQNIPESRKSEGINYYSMSTTLATAFGPFLGIFMTQHTTFPVLFLVCLILMGLSLMISFSVKVISDNQSQAIHTKALKFKDIIKNSIEINTIPIGIIILLLSFAYSGVLTYLNLYASQINLIHIASFFFIMYSIMVFLSRPLTGKLMDYRGHNIVMYPAFIFYALSMFMLSTVNNGFVLLLIGGIMGLGFGNLQSATQVIAVKSASKSRISVATSTYFICFDAGLGLSPYLLGYITPITGYAHMFGLMAIIILLTGIVYFLIHGLKETKEKLAK